MVDQESSKIIWVAIGVALASVIYFIARTQINDIAVAAFAKVKSLVTDPNQAAPASKLITGFFG